MDVTTNMNRRSPKILGEQSATCSSRGGDKRCIAAGKLLIIFLSQPSPMIDSEGSRSAGLGVEKRWSPKRFWAQLTDRMTIALHSDTSFRYSGR
jgi:hypothetical protein